MRKPFEPGNTYGAAGRPRGSKNRLTARVLEDMHKVWGGARVRKQDCAG